MGKSQKKEKVRKIKLKSYAKINLSLDVLGKRDDGYHLISTVMQQISLFDIIDISWEEAETEKLNIFIRTNKKYLPADERNLAYKAAVLLNEYAEKRGNLSIEIEKRVPVAAGLAGGSGNAAAVIIALNRLWGLGKDTRELCEIGGRLGADIPFMILVQNSRYTCALGEGTGEILTPLRNELNMYFTLSKPKFGVSTKEVYTGIDAISDYEHPDTEGLIEALNERDNERAISLMANVLENYTLRAYPKVEMLKKKVLKTEGIKFAMMSGSGSTIIGFYEKFDDARKAAESLRSIGYESYYAGAMKRIRGKKK